MMQPINAKPFVGNATTQLDGSLAINNVPFGTYRIWVAPNKEAVLLGRIRYFTTLRFRELERHGLDRDKDEGLYVYTSDCHFGIVRCSHA
jgi:hypothetical protein